MKQIQRDFRTNAPASLATLWQDGGPTTEAKERGGVWLRSNDGDQVVVPREWVREVHRLFGQALKELDHR